MTTAPIPLTIEPDATQITRLRERIDGRRWVVVGSAPLPTPTAQIEDGEAVLVVNGAISSVAGEPDLWFLNSKPQDTHWSANLRGLHNDMLRQGAGRRASHIVFLRGVKAASEQETLKHLSRLGSGANSWSVLDKPAKWWLENRICDRATRDSKNACSAGLFATAVLLWSGALHVRMTGFSWVGGYHYLPKHTKMVRNHGAADGRALRALALRYPDRLEGEFLTRAVAS